MTDPDAAAADRVQRVAIIGFAAIALSLIVAYGAVALFTDLTLTSPMEIVSLVVVLMAVSAGVSVKVSRK